MSLKLLLHIVSWCFILSIKNPATDYTEVLRISILNLNFGAVISAKLKSSEPAPQKIDHKQTCSGPNSHPNPYFILCEFESGFPVQVLSTS